MARQFQQVSTTTWLALASTFIVYTGACILVSTVVFQNRIGQCLSSLYAASGYLIQSTLVGGLVCFALTGPVIFGVGRCRGKDVGWRTGAVIVGAIVTFAFWLVMQGILAVVATFGGQIAVNANWNQSGGRELLGGILGQVLGNALVEETVFRGFFLTQFYLKAAQRFQSDVAMIGATLGSSVLFSVTHVPNLLFIKNMDQTDILMSLVGLVALGLLFGGIYLVTGNLFIAVGLHAIINNPSPLVLSAEITLGAVWFGLTVALLIAWPRIERLCSDTMH
jgi:membrane protease YdiL (CAAX protease family)